MRGVKKLENHGEVLKLEAENNCFLIDWLTFVAHGDTVEYLKWLLGLDGADIPWEVEQKFRNGYPMQCYWNGITISYGADDPAFYKDPSKVNYDMGICVNFSGTGCRAFETYGHGDWLRLFTYLFRDTDVIVKEQDKFKRYNVTRVDLAYDDHTGILDIYQIEKDTRDRYYVSRAKKSKIIWSDNQDTDIQGLTVQIGSDSSEIKIRIYDKAAERGFKDRHWIRVETQLRDDRALSACKQYLDLGHIGKCVGGILRNYLTYRVPTEDSNKSRWPIAPYWDKLLLDMERIRLWVSPGEEYNISRSEHWLLKQYGPTMVILNELHDPYYLIDKAKRQFPVKELPPKYQRVLQSFDIKKPFDPVPDEATPFDFDWDQMSVNDLGEVTNEEIITYPLLDPNGGPADQ